MASYLTTPTCHVMLPSSLECHCCRYFIGKGGDVRGNLEAWYFAWKLSTISVASQILFGEIQKLLTFSQDWQKTSSQGCDEGTFSMKAMEACCRFPQIKSWSTHGYLPPWSKNRLQQLLQEHHHCHFYTNYATFTVLRQDSTANEGYLGLP